MHFIVTDYGVVAGSQKLQTAQIQAVLDRCRDKGGKVIFPAGEYVFSSLYVYSDTEIYLCKGAKLIGSDEISDYFEFDKLNTVTSYHDFIVLDPQVKHYGFTAKGYTLSMFTSVSEKNISFVCEDDSLIDGKHCFNAEGDQNYRGPHTIWMTDCKNVRFEKVVIERSGNFAFQLDGCKGVTLQKVAVRRGDDGIHLNASEDIVIEDSSFETGDDSIAGLNVVNLLVTNCYVNSACDCFRLGGKNIRIENSRMIGPGKYPHRVSTAKGKNHELPDEEGRLNTNVMFCYFASDVYPMDSENIVFENCEIDGIDRFFYDSHSFDVFQSGGIIKDLTLKNVSVKNLKLPSIVNEQTAFYFENVTVSDKDKNII